MEVDIRNIPLESYPKGITNDGFYPQNTIMIHTLAFGAETTSTKTRSYTMEQTYCYGLFLIML
ncbi:hypothetical protein R3X28_16125 [Maribacter sp. TH_r10]|uniref:hypothetical protein n=1 Tax=Maribacter sp. TH_r10 TaxID=3082086 RepID=UPI002953001F|nr:hypothetical protein [Maribacter sp. TH_r10]MDV7140420.1 hypothetical protein [Maribacter sp. TH_r10]